MLSLVSSYYAPCRHMYTHYSTQSHTVAECGNLDQQQRALEHKSLCQMLLSSLMDEHNLKLEMWSNAQRDGRPAEYRWRPLFNAAKFG